MMQWPPTNGKITWRQALHHVIVDVLDSNYQKDKFCIRKKYQIISTEGNEFKDTDCNCYFFSDPCQESTQQSPNTSLSYVPSVITKENKIFLSQVAKMLQLFLFFWLCRGKHTMKSPILHFHMSFQLLGGRKGGGQRKGTQNLATS